MGTTLTGTQIQNTYDGLIKVTDNGPIGATPKLLTDGLGNDSKIAVGTAGTDFTGNVDFSGATVTGLPAGSAGLESGTGADSMQSAASLTTTPANAAATDSIALGDGATVAATATNGIAIGVNATTSGSGSDGQLAIGNGSVVSNNKGIAIGVNGTSVTNSEGLAIGDNVDISLSDRSIGIGAGINISGGSDKVAIGTSASVTGQRGLAFGQNSSSTANEAIALGYNVTAANAQTVSVRALETQTNSTPTAGGIIMSDAGGTDRRLNITATGDLQIDSTPVGGGGGGAWATPTGTMSKMLTYNDQATHYRTWVQTTGYGRTATASTTLDRAYYGVFSIEPGETISKVHIDVWAAVAASTVEVAFYDMEVDGTGRLYLNDQLYNVGLIPSDVTGMKNITLGTPFTWPTGKNVNLLAVVLWSSDGNVQLTGWNQGIWNGGGYYAALGNIYYRAMSVHCKPGVANGTALPATIGPKSGSTITYSADTSNPLVVGIS